MAVVQASVIALNARYHQTVTVVSPSVIHTATEPLDIPVISYANPPPTNKSRLAAHQLHLVSLKHLQPNGLE